MKGIYNNIEVTILEENRDTYFIYKKDVVCGYVNKDLVIIQKECTDIIKQIIKN